YLYWTESSNGPIMEISSRQTSEYAAVTGLGGSGPTKKGVWLEISSSSSTGSQSTTPETSIFKYRTNLKDQSRLALRITQAISTHTLIVTTTLHPFSGPKLLAPLT